MWESEEDSMGEYDEKEDTREEVDVFMASTEEEIDVFMASTEEQNIEEDINIVGPSEYAVMKIDLEDMSLECTNQQEDE